MTRFTWPSACTTPPTRWPWRASSWPPSCCRKTFARTQRRACRQTGGRASAPPLQSPLRFRTCSTSSLLFSTFINAMLNLKILLHQLFLHQRFLHPQQHLDLHLELLMLPLPLHPLLRLLLSLPSLEVVLPQCQGPPLDHLSLHSAGVV